MWHRFRSSTSGWPTADTADAAGAATAPGRDQRREPIDDSRRPRRRGLTQWRVLTRRTLETFVRNPLTLAILLASPVLVVAMFAVLFRPGAFDFHNPSPSSMVMIGFWVVFAAFFFGITYGLLQICTEHTIVRRERLVGLRLGAYVASKVTVLVPFLLVVIVAMLGRAASAATVCPTARCRRTPRWRSSLLLCAIAALGLGLLTSAVGPQRRPGNARAADAVLPRGPVRRRDPAGAPDGEGRRRVQRADAVPVGRSRHRSRPRCAPDPRSRRLPTRTAAARLVRRRRAARPLGHLWLILAAFVVVFLAATWAVLVRSTGRSVR